MVTGYICRIAASCHTKVKKLYMSRRKFVTANWKMNLNLMEGEILIDQLILGLPPAISCEVALSPPFTHLHMAVQKTNGTPITVAAQHCHFKNAGAFTGEVSVPMLKSIGVKYIITGHSERREIFLETNSVIRGKVDAIVREGLIPIFCCGEPLEIRQAGSQNDFVRTQLEESLFHLESNTIGNTVIAYEPIWAIGTGITASPEQAQEMHAYIRSLLADRYGPGQANEIRLLYGGSIKSDNAQLLFSQQDVDGGLVGGASLQARGFLEIIEAACG